MKFITLFGIVHKLFENDYSAFLLFSSKCRKTMFFHMPILIRRHHKWVFLVHQKSLAFLLANEY